MGAVLCCQRGALFRLPRRLSLDAVHAAAEFRRMKTRSSADFFAAAQARIPGGVNSPVRAFRGLGRAPFFVERAMGAKIWDVDGNEYIDYVGTWGPAILGHAPEVVVRAVQDAATRGVSFGIP